ncbi:MAG: hypothetical protein CBB87_11105 [Micavibrio sp. TMED27]|nr:hypothetical protein [Micavibrio sp.]OUT89841.1 MAG: hypothetical protein CBB87_11105 [Micavibrio sp. TMED27]
MNMPIPAKQFYMLRHGQTEANKARILAGDTESALTELGREQARNARKIIENLEVKPAAIFHSHLSRARDTASIINENLKLPMHEDRDLGEKHAGILEGAPYEKCLREFNDWVDIEGGETAEEFFTRIKRAKANAISQYNDPVLIVCHGGVMRGFGMIYNFNVPGKFDNAHLHEFTPKHEQDNFPWNVHHYNFNQNKSDVIRKLSELYHPHTPSSIA